MTENNENVVPRVVTSYFAPINFEDIMAIAEAQALKTKESELPSPSAFDVIDVFLDPKNKNEASRLEDEIVKLAATDKSAANLLLNKLQKEIEKNEQNSG